MSTLVQCLLTVCNVLDIWPGGQFGSISGLLQDLLCVHEGFDVLSTHAFVHTPARFIHIFDWICKKGTMYCPKVI